VAAPAYLAPPRPLYPVNRARSALPAPLVSLTLSSQGGTLEELYHAIQTQEVTYPPEVPIRCGVSPPGTACWLTKKSVRAGFGVWALVLRVCVLLISQRALQPGCGHLDVLESCQPGLYGTGQAAVR
jgi:hypothetical protein